MAVYKVRSGGNEYDVTVTDHAGGGATVSVNGQSFEVESVGPVVAPPAAASPPAATPAALPPALAAPAPAAGGSGSVTAPIPGVVTSVLVKAGDTVAAGQIVLKLEAMKMENAIATPAAGTVTEARATPNEQFQQGQLLMALELDASDDPKEN